MAALGMRVTCLAAVAAAADVAPLDSGAAGLDSADIQSALDGADGGVPRAWRLLRSAASAAEHAAREDAMSFEIHEDEEDDLSGDPSGEADADELVGTLDIHVGDRLPGEWLEGALPVPMPAAAPAQLLSRLWDAGKARDAAAPPAAAAARLSARAAYRNAAEAQPQEDAPADAAAVAAAAAQVFSLHDALCDADAAAAAAHQPDEPSGAEAEAAAAAAAAAAARPAGAATAGARGYIFNVCVAPAARRRGVAARLLAAAVAEAAAMRVTWLYVHVEADNPAARGLYAAAGFSEEAAEPEWLARRLGRPARLLLRRQLTADDIA
jgi:ribosomal protein S18 acetylase RimI-like enzyme